MFRSLGSKPFLIPTPLCLVGTYDHAGRPNIMTAAWTGVCSSQPPCVAVSVRRNRWSYQAILERKSFTLSVPSRDLSVRTDFAGMHSGRDSDKFSTLNFTPVPAEHVDAPYVAECPAVLELALIKTVELGSHTQFIGEIMDIKIAENCLREDGMPDPAKIDPLLYVPLLQEYWSLGSFTAKAFSAGYAVSPSALVN